jgi:hypothetical protein
VHLDDGFMDRCAMNPTAAVQIAHEPDEARLVRHPARARARAGGA